MFNLQRDNFVHHNLGMYVNLLSLKTPAYKKMLPVISKCDKTFFATVKNIFLQVKALCLVYSPSPIRDTLKTIISSCNLKLNIMIAIFREV